mgnify:FL=1
MHDTTRHIHESVVHITVSMSLKHNVIQVVVFKSLEKNEYFTDINLLIHELAT